MKTGILILLAVGALLVAAYKQSENKTSNRGSNASANSSSADNNAAQNSTNSEVQNSRPDAAASYSYSDPPQVNASLSVDDAYSSIPHRRTVWSDDQTTVPAGEREYLKAMFQVLDAAVVARVAGIQNYSRGDFTSFDAEGQLGQLNDYVRQAHVPPALVDYNSRILAALTGSSSSSATGRAILSISITCER